jgi:single-stranded-DNA-specific exonuclease
MDDVRVRPVVVRPVPAIGNSIDVHPVLQRIYAARGVTQVEDLDYALRGLLPVSTLTGVDEAVELIADHAEKHITIIGDFDADGATSTALVIRCLREFGISNVDYLVPNRFKFGYGLTPEPVLRASRRRTPSI